MVENLNESQRQSVEFNGKHALVLAGAGTGKTRTIIHRAAYLIAQGILPGRIQILSFTRKSANEIVERVSTLFSNSPEAKQLKGSTFHAWCMDIIKSNPVVFKVSDHTVIDRDDQLSLFKLICGKNIKVIEETRLRPAALLELYSFARNTRKNITETVRAKFLNHANDETANMELESIKPYLIDVFSKYESKKRERKYLDYDDILDVVASGLRKNKEARDFISAQYDHILVDEMQDTNPLQWELLSAFRENCCLFCVGDDAQSIYGFRGADFTNVHKFSERVPGSVTFRLEDNYRSTQQILNLSNWLLEKSPLDYKKQLKAIRGAGEIPVIMNFENEWQEAEWVTKDILENYTQDGMAYADHLVLVRSSAAARKLEHYFLEHKIPYALVGGTGLMRSAHIRDIASALRIVANIYDEIAWVRYLTLWSKIGEQTAGKIIAKILGLDTLQECIDLLRKHNGIDPAVISTLESIKNLNTNPSAAIQAALRSMEKQLSISYKENWEEKRKHDFKILSKLAEKHGTIGEFITEYILDPQLNESYLNGTEGKDIVTISTIHSAKGLEAKVCYVINVSTGVYPGNYSIKEGQEAIEEDRRVLYVALTRAKDELYITRLTRSIQEYGPTMLSLKSDQVVETENYFLNELPEGMAIDLIPEFVKRNLNTRAYQGQAIEDDDFGIDLS